LTPVAQRLDIFSLLHDRMFKWNQIVDWNYPWLTIF
jgi:hypothetical protein